MVGGMTNTNKVSWFNEAADYAKGGTSTSAW